MSVLKWVLIVLGAIVLIGVVVIAGTFFCCKADEP